MPPADDTPPRDAAEVEEDVAAPFGSQEPTRVAADVSYRGRVGEHDYLVRVRHRLLEDRKSTRLNSSHVAISYAVFCLKKKNALTVRSIRTRPSCAACLS